MAITTLSRLFESMRRSLAAKRRANPARYPGRGYDVFKSEAKEAVFASLRLSKACIFVPNGQSF